MTAETSASDAPMHMGASVDAQHPWLGLSSFTEESRAYFYGREEEVGELSRRVQRKLLTILFGQSGLGKTSILRAGVVPRLRTQGYCPVYVRIAYDPDAPEPAEQIKQAIFRAAQELGQWTQTGVAVEGESLWEFLHHRDDVLRDASGTTLLPLLIFDQFEEIFTLAQGDDRGRQRAARFIEDLADLVENRAPKSFEEKLDKDEAAVERFDFTRSDYRILIALREDYLAPLEGLKGVMPSITQNRMRLAPMTGIQALAAVTGPGKQLVTEEVAAAIVRFVAGGAELANAEVEPSLLSLICRELNDSRIAQGRTEISLEMLDGSHAGILGEFYDRALADQPEAVRRFIEDELLTESGFRENVAEERVLREFSDAGAAPDALAALVNRRLLRIEERLDIRRVELTHDVLCRFVKESRDQRHEREARAATERMLADQRERARATRRALVRARQIAAVCAIFALGAVVAAVFAYASTQRAQRAERAAIETREVAEQARGEAQHLLAYLVDDLSLELEGVGRLGVVGDLAKQEVAYYKALPAELQTEDSVRSGALAQVRFGIAMRGLGRLDAASQALGEARATLEKQRAQGDQSQATTIGLALALNGQAAVEDSNLQLPESEADAGKAIALLQPIVDASDVSIDARRAYGQVSVRFGYEQLRLFQEEQSIETLERGKKVLAPLVAAQPMDISAAADTAQMTGWELSDLVDQGRYDDARRVGADGLDVATRLLAERPMHMAGLRARGLVESGLTQAANHSLRPREAIEFSMREEADWATITRLDPGNIVAWNNRASAMGSHILALSRIGRDREAIVLAHQYDEILRGVGGDSGMIYFARIFGLAYTSTFELDTGENAAAQVTLAELAKTRAAASKAKLSGPTLAYFDCLTDTKRADGKIAEGDWTGAAALATQTIERRRATPILKGDSERTKNQCLVDGMSDLGFAQYRLHDYPHAEASLRQAVELRNTWPLQNIDERRGHAWTVAALALVLAREGRTGDALATIAPEVRTYREISAINHGDLEVQLEEANVTYVSALADPEHRSAQLKRSLALVTALPAEMQKRHSVALLRADIEGDLKQGADVRSQANPGK